MAFDTGFVTFEKGWDSIREDDRGLLWEHLILDGLRHYFGDNAIFYWQDKSHREIDFVVRRSRDRIDALECKINPDKLDPEPFRAFRALYPDGENVVVSPFVKQRYSIRKAGLIFTIRSVRGVS